VESQFAADEREEVFLQLSAAASTFFEGAGEKWQSIQKG